MDQLSLRKSSRTKLSLNLTNISMLWLCFVFDKCLMTRFLKCWKFTSYFISDANICFLLHRHLSELALLYCQRIGDAGLLQIGQGCKYLQALHLVDCSSIGDVAMCGIARGCKNLKKLHIRRCYEVLSAFVFGFLHENAILYVEF